MALFQQIFPRSSDLTMRIEIVIGPFSRIGMLINTGGRRLARIRPATKGQIYIR